MELAAERVPKFLTAAIPDPREEFVRREAEGHRREEIEAP